MRTQPWLKTSLRRSWRLAYCAGGWPGSNNGCTYTGNIFTFKNRVTVHMIIFTLKSVIVSFSYSISGFFYDMNFPFFLLKNNYSPFNVSLSFHCFSFLYYF